MKVLHVLALGGAGGIESLCADIAQYSQDENHFYFLWGGGNNADKIKSFQCNVVIRNFTYSNIWKEYQCFRSYITDKGIECIVIQGVSPVMLLYFRMVLKKYSNLKGCLYLHANSEDLFSRKWVKWLFQWAGKQADGYIAISDSVRNSMKGICDISQIHRIYNGVSCKKFDKRTARIEHNIIQLIYVGRIVRRKGLFLLIEALKEITLPYELTIIGEGSDKEELRQEIRRAGISEKVNLPGTQWNIEEWLTKADVFVHPATWQEGFGITLIEAMSAGLPCIAFRRGAIPEIITDNVDGYLVEPVNEQAYKEKLNEVIRQWQTEPETFAAIAKNARKRAECFDIQVYVKELSEYLSQIVYGACV